MNIFVSNLINTKNCQYLLVAITGHGLTTQTHGFVTFTGLIFPSGHKKLKSAGSAMPLLESAPK